MPEPLAHVAALAHERLDPGSAATFLDLVRPAVALDVAGPDDLVVARLGGQPRLPAGTPWPERDGAGPLSFVGELDLAALSLAGHDPAVVLPTTGRLAFFVLDDPDDGVADPAHPDSSRVLHLTDGGSPTTAPDGAQTYAERELTGRHTVTAPDIFHPALPAAFGIDTSADRGAWLDHPANDVDLYDAVEQLRGTEPRHQVGGWAAGLQGPVELDAAYDEVRRRSPARRGQVPDADEVDAETDRWALVFQVDSYDDVLWGDAGSLYWLARTEDLARGDLGDIRFVSQSC